MERDIWRIGRVALAFAYSLPTLAASLINDRPFILFTGFFPSQPKRMAFSFIPFLVFFSLPTPFFSSSYFFATSISFANSLWLLRGFHRSKFVRKLNFNTDVMHVRIAIRVYAVTATDTGAVAAAAAISAVVLLLLYRTLQMLIKYVFGWENINWNGLASAAPLPQPNIPSSHSVCVCAWGWLVHFHKWENI